MQDFCNWRERVANPIGYDSRIEINCNLFSIMTELHVAQWDRLNHIQKVYRLQEW